MPVVLKRDSRSSLHVFNVSESRMDSRTVSLNRAKGAAGAPVRFQPDLERPGNSCIQGHKLNRMLPGQLNEVPVR